MGGTLRNRSTQGAQDAQHETTWRKKGAPVSLFDHYVGRVPFPAFFVVGAMFGVLFAMAVIITFRVPKDLVIVPPQSTHVRSTVVTTHAKVLFVWRPQLTASSSTSPSPSSSAVVEVAGAPAIAVVPASTTHAAPRTYRVASIRRPAPGMPANLLSAGL